MPYVGGKQTMADQIVSLMAPHDHYVEPFFGGGSVLFAKAPALMETVNDIDEHLVTFWRVLRDRPCDLAWKCATTPHSRVEMAVTRSIDAGDPDDLERARRVWVQLTQGRAARLTRTGWRYVVEYTGLSISTIRKALATGALPSHRVGRRILISLDDVDAYIRGEGDDGQDA